MPEGEAMSLKHSGRVLVTVAILGSHSSCSIYLDKPLADPLPYDLESAGAIDVATAVAKGIAGALEVARDRQAPPGAGLGGAPAPNGGLFHIADNDILEAVADEGRKVVVSTAVTTATVATTATVSTVVTTGTVSTTTTVSTAVTTGTTGTR